MKKSYLKNIIKEVLQEEIGYSKYVDGGKTKGLTPETINAILLRIAKGDNPGYEDDQVTRGNKVLDKADPKNVERILNGKKPVYEEEVDRMQELAGLKSEIKVNNPNKNWDEAIENLLDRFSDGNDNEYQPGHQMDDNFEIELGEGDILEDLYQYLKNKDNKRIKVEFKNKIPMELTANDSYDDQGFGYINLKYKEPKTWEGINY